MKKIVAIILGAVLILSFASGCGKEDTNTGAVSSISSVDSVGSVSAAPIESEEFKVPEKYTSAILITINPVVKLYLDDSNVVLAVEYINNDAKTAYSKIEKEIIGAKLESGVKKLIGTAFDAGYFKKEQKVTVDILECKAEGKKKTVLAAVGSTVKQTLQDSKIEASIEVKDNGTAVDDATFKEVTMTEAEKKAEADRLAAEQAAKEQAQKLADAKNPKKSLKIGTRYICAEKSELAEAEYLFTFITFNSNGEYGYGMGDYSTKNLYGDNDPIIYEGKKYYNCSGLGGGGEYTFNDTEIKLVQNKVVFEMNEKSELVIKSATDGDNAFKVGKVFKLAK